MPESPGENIEVRFASVIAEVAPELAEGQEALYDLLTQTETNVGRILTPAEVALNAHYWKQHLQREDVGAGDLRFFNPEKEAPIFKGAPEGFDQARNTAQQLFENHDELAEFFSKLDIETTLKEQNLLIASTHAATWFDLPSIAYFLQEACGVSGENIYIVQGPALFTFNQGPEGLAVANALLTVPDTSNSQIPGESVTPLISSIRTKFLRTLKEHFLAEESKGQVLIIAPTGSRGRYVDGHYELKRPSRGSSNLVDKTFAAAQNWYRLAIGFGDQALAKPGGQGWQKGRVDIAAEWRIKRESMIEVLPGLLGKGSHYVEENTRDAA